MGACRYVRQDLACICDAFREISGPPRASVAPSSLGARRGPEISRNASQMQARSCRVNDTRPRSGCSGGKEGGGGGPPIGVRSVRSHIVFCRGHETTLPWHRRLKLTGILRRTPKGLKRSCSRTLICKKIFGFGTIFCRGHADDLTMACDP